jgi:hypothetical protein
VFGQQMLGHSSATMTLDTYGHRIDDRLDEVGAAMDAARAASQARRNTAFLLPRVALVLPEPEFEEMTKDPCPAFLLVRGPFRLCTPDRIRTGATALRGRRARPLHNGGVCPGVSPEQPAKL